jgi:FAD binding domain/Berberine and berberine like
VTISENLGSAVKPGDMNELQNQLQGIVLRPGEADYEAARHGWNLCIDQHPALILRVKNTADIVEAVRFACQHDLDIAVKSTGHGVVRPADGCLLIDVSLLKEVRIHPTAQTAWVSAGVKWGQVLEAAQAFGLAPLLGSSPDVGAVGYTLGGGMGWLVRKYGLSTDSVHYFELVTADGEIRRASPEENSDLFWGLRGGGGSLGVITGMEIQLYPVSTVYGGNLLYPAEDAVQVIRRYREWIASAPDELTSSIVLANFPPLPVFPEPLRGKSFIIVRGCYCGPVEQGATLVQGWRDWKTPYMDAWHVMPFGEVATISNDPPDPIPGLTSGAWVGDLSDEAIDVLVRFGLPAGGPSPVMITEIRHAGGAVEGVASEANAYGNREATLNMQLIGMAPVPEARQAFDVYTARFKQALAPHLTGGVYINFLDGEEARQRIQDAYQPQAYQRLQELKARYDPDNRFCYSFNITPAAAARS